MIFFFKFLGCDLFFLMKSEVWESSTKLSIKKTFFSSMFLLKKDVKFFSSIHPLRKNFICVVVLPDFVEITFCGFFKMICQNDFKYDNINFQKQRKQPEK